VAAVGLPSGSQEENTYLDGTLYATYYFITTVFILPIT
jgi:hypothetical protein